MIIARPSSPRTRRYFCQPPTGSARVSYHLRTRGGISILHFASVRVRIISAHAEVFLNIHIHTLLLNHHLRACGGISQLLTHHPLDMTRKLSPHTRRYFGGKNEQMQQEGYHLRARGGISQNTARILASIVNRPRASGGISPNSRREDCQHAIISAHAEVFRRASYKKKGSSPRTRRYFGRTGRSVLGGKNHLRTRGGISRPAIP